MISFDTPDESLDDRGFADVEREISVDVEGANGREIGFNGFWLEPPLTQEGDPLNDGCLVGGEDGVVGVEVLRIELDKFDERFLTGIVGRAS